MATRSAIFNELTGQLRYIHWDGYPEGVGATLTQHYGTQERVDDLFARAVTSDLSSLEATVEDCEWYNFELTFPGHYNAAEAHAVYQDAHCQYLYVWNDGKWRYYHAARAAS